MGKRPWLRHLNLSLWVEVWVQLWVRRLQGLLNGQWIMAAVLLYFLHQAAPGCRKEYSRSCRWPRHVRHWENLGRRVFPTYLFFSTQLWEALLRALPCLETSLLQSQRPLYVLLAQ